MPTQTSTIDQLVQPLGDCLSPEVARRIIALRADAQLQARVEELAEKANFGVLSDEERSEYEQYISFASFVALLQIKAHQLLEHETDAA